MTEIKETGFKRDCYRCSPFVIDDNSASNQNPVSLLGHLDVEELCVELSQLKGHTEVLYLVLNVGQVRVNVELAEYTQSVAAQIASIQLVDKQTKSKFLLLVIQRLLFVLV